jgi:hypothetical protein
MIAMVAGGMPDSAGVDVAAECRRYVVAMLARDGAYDEAGRSPEAPPVSLVDYRRGLCALVAMEPLSPVEPGRWVRAGEELAYRAGQQAWQEAMVGAVAAVWRAAVARRMRAGMSRRQLACWWVPAGRLTAVVSDGAYVRGMLAWDVEYDDDPRGAPPLLVHGYRSALSVVMRLEPVPLARVGRFVTDSENAAFEAGQWAAFDWAAMVVGRAWRPADGLGRVFEAAGDGGIVVGGAGWHRCAGLCGGR